MGSEETMEVQVIVVDDRNVRISRVGYRLSSD